jgi:choline dehydrogenase-like flavoprotein
MRLLPTQQDHEPQVNLLKPYDAVIVGSGAAGGMAAYALTERGLDVLLLEAGKPIDTTQVLHSMEWPYDHPRRGDMPSKYHALSRNEYNIRQPPYATSLGKYDKVFSYVQDWGGSDYSTSIVVNEKDHPYTGTNYAWVRARCLGGKTNIWGRLALRLSDYDFKAKSRDGYGELADLLCGHRALLRQGRSVSRNLRREGESAASARQPLPTTQQAGPAEFTLRNSIRKMNRVLTPYRAGVTTDGRSTTNRSKCFGRGRAAAAWEAATSMRRSIPPPGSSIPRWIPAT